VPSDNTTITLIVAEKTDAAHGSQKPTRSVADFLVVNNHQAREQAHPRSRPYTNAEEAEGVKSIAGKLILVPLISGIGTESIGACIISAKTASINAYNILVTRVAIRACLRFSAT
jgi:mannitol-specific phosphotransferase system IIBC component